MKKEDLGLVNAGLMSELKMANQIVEDAEVVLSNLLALINTDNQTFGIPFDDVIVTLSLAVRLLDKYQHHQINFYFASTEVTRD